MADVLMVCGDMGGANVIRLLYPEFTKRDLSVQIVADGGEKAKAHLVLKKVDLPFERYVCRHIIELGGIHMPSQFRSLVEESHIIFVTPCVTAFLAGEAAVAYGVELKNKTTILGPGLDFDHAYLYPGFDFGYVNPHWRVVAVNYVIANNRFQKSSILALRPSFSPAQAPILGNPIFDSIPKLVIGHSEIRAKVRQTLGLREDKKMILYWSPGEIEELCEASFKALIIGLNGLAKIHDNLVLCLKLHPKLDASIRQGYYGEKEALIKGACTALGIRLIADVGEIAAEELNSGADLVIAERATQAIMAAMCGIPTAFILLPVHGKFFEAVLFQKFPYLHVLDEGAALGIFQEEDIVPALESMLVPSEERKGKLKWNAARTMPHGDAAEKIAEFVANLLRR